MRRPRSLRNTVAKALWLSVCCHSLFKQSVIKAFAPIGDAVVVRVEQNVVAIVRLPKQKARNRSFVLVGADAVEAWQHSDTAEQPAFEVWAKALIADIDDLGGTGSIDGE